MIGESGFPEGAIKEIAGAIAREHAASAVGAVSAGRESNDEKACERVAKAGNRLTPILLAAISPPLHAPDFFSMGNEPGTCAAIPYLLVKHVQSAETWDG